MFSEMRYLLLREGFTAAKVHKIPQNQGFFGGNFHTLRRRT